MRNMVVLIETLSETPVVLHHPIQVWDIITEDCFVGNISSFESRTVDSETVLSAPSLIVQQSEVATVRKEDGFQFVGSESATTCHLLFATERTTSQSPLTVVAHCDRVSSASAHVETISELFRGSGQESEVDLSIIGGYADEGQTSEKLTEALFDALIKSDITFHLKLFYSGERNTSIENGVAVPKVQDAVFSFSDSMIYKCHFQEPCGPARAIRGLCCSPDLHVLFRSPHLSVARGQPIIEIGPFEYEYEDFRHQVANAPDELILKFMSTSPFAEKSCFAHVTRSTALFVIQHPDWKQVFPEASPLRFVLSKANKWVLQGKSCISEDFLYSTPP
eukprot:726861_1